jgi:hypothetical protein
MPAIAASQVNIESRPLGGRSVTTSPVGWLNNYFYLFMSLLIAVLIVYGFSHTVDKNLIHPAVPRPFLLYIHATVFGGWVVFYILQSALVRTHNVKVHRRTGWFGVALGVVIPVVGISTAITMTRFNIVQLHHTDAASFMLVPFFDIVAFSTTFALGIYWRKKPEMHRRLLLIASCALTAAAFGRFPPNLLPPVIFYAGVDLLILLGVVRDLVVNRRVHRVYQYALPGFIVGQTVVMYTVVHNSPYWLKIANAIVR